MQNKKKLGRTILTVRWLLYFVNVGLVIVLISHIVALLDVWWYGGSNDVAWVKNTTPFPKDIEGSFLEDIEDVAE